MLPQQFKHLEDLSSWIESDDVERSIILDSATSNSLRMLIERVSPEFEAINAYLDEHEYEDNEETHALGRLAEAASEAQFEIKRRSPSA